MSSCATSDEENETDEVSDDKMMHPSDRDDVMMLLMLNRSATEAVL